VRYAVGIPTRGRHEILYKCINALANQTVPPSLIVVVDNNDEIGTLDVPIPENKDRISLYIAVSKYGKSPSAGHQEALDIIREEKFDIAVRWDDDLIPEPDCLGKLVSLVYNGTTAAGGVYPRPEYKEGPFVVSGKPPDGNRRHLQFFKWQEDFPLIVMSHFLYSSFAYNVLDAVIAGGFTPEYSCLGHREETDFSLRLNDKSPPLLIHTKAIAYHYVCDSGTRDIKDSQKRKDLIAADELLFLKRMKERDINPDY